MNAKWLTISHIKSSDTSASPSAPRGADPGHVEWRIEPGMDDPSTTAESSGVYSPLTFPVSQPGRTLARPPEASVETTAAAAMTDDRCLTDLADVDDLLQRLEARSLFLVADETAYEFSGARAKLAPVTARYSTTLFTGFEPNPKLRDVERGIEQFRRSGADVVLAVGGGTAIDIAKLIVVLSDQPSGPAAAVRNQSAASLRPACPLIVAPTTSGSGSEATQFAVLYVDGVKHSVDHPSLLPAHCVLDASLTARLPASITMQCGLDAFSQAVESMWSVRCTDASLQDASEAAQLALNHLKAAVHAPTPAARAAMLRASHLAGRAINRTRTTAPHAISYALTSDHGVPHGQAVALTLGPMLVHNAGITADDSNDPRGPQHVRQRIGRILDLLGCRTPEEGREAIKAFVKAVGGETRLGAVGITEPEQIASIVGKVNSERLGNNPRRLTAEQLSALLQSIR